MDFILTPQPAAGALPAFGTQAVKPCPLDKGKANPVPSEGTQVGLTRLRDLTRGRGKEEGRGGELGWEERGAKSLSAGLPSPTTIPRSNNNQLCK